MHDLPPQTYPVSWSSHLYATCHGLTWAPTYCQDAPIKSWQVAGWGSYVVHLKVCQSELSLYG